MSSCDSNNGEQCGYAVGKGAAVRGRRQRDQNENIIRGGEIIRGAETETLRNAGLRTLHRGLSCGEEWHALFPKQGEREGLSIFLQVLISSITRTHIIGHRKPPNETYRQHSLDTEKAGRTRVNCY